MKLLRVSENKRYLENIDGEPFFYLGDTAWELFHKLDREEAELYIKTRAEQGFNVIQAVALAELSGLDKPNAYGRTPLLKNENGEYDPTMPDTEGEYSYWAHVDYVISLIEKYGMYVGLLPTWGDKYNLKWGVGPVIFTPDNARVYGEWIGKRYADRDNIIWILGGDRPMEEQLHYDVNDALAAGVRTGDGGRFLITFHPSGTTSSSQYFHDREWLDFNMAQSGHGGYTKSYELVSGDYARTPVKPMLDGEPCYEDHPKNFEYGNGFFDATDVRNALYQNSFCGACGNTYGHYSAWCFAKEFERFGVMDWQDTLHRPAAENEKVFASFIKDYPLHVCTPSEEIVKDNKHDANFMPSMVGEDYILTYVPSGIGFFLDTDKVAAYPKAKLFNPRTGEYTESFSFRDDGRVSLPTKGRGEDWVLILEK